MDNNMNNLNMDLLFKRFQEEVLKDITTEDKKAIMDSIIITLSKI